MHRKIAGRLAVLAAVALTLTACGAGEKDAGGTPSAGESQAASDEKLDIGIVTFSASDVATSATVKGAQDEAAALGWTSSLVDANGSVDAANTAIEDFVTKGVDAILVTVFPSDALSTGLAAAKGADIPVVTMGGGEGPGVAYQEDDILPTQLSEKLVADVPDGASILALNYRGGRPCQLREAGFDQVTDGIANLTIEKQQTPVPGQVEASQAATLAWLAKTDVVPGKTVVWTCFDDQAMGVVAALKQQGLNPGDVWVYSINGTEDALHLVRDGWMKTDGWIDHPGAGKDMVDIVKEIRAAGGSWEYKSVPAPFELVSSENYEQFVTDHPELGL